MDLDFWYRFKQGNPHLTAEFHMTNYHILGLFGEKKFPFYSQVNTVHVMKVPYKFYVLGQRGLSKQCRPKSDCF